MEAQQDKGSGWTSIGLDDYDLRLMALVHHLVRKEGRMYASARLGVDSRTLASCLSKGRLTDKMRGAAELILASGDNPVIVELGAGLKALEGRMGDLEGEMTRAKSESEAGLAGLREEYGERLREVESWLESLEAGHVPGSSASGLQRARKEPEAKSHRKYPDLVTMEPAPDEREVLRTAWPLVEEWRRLTKEHPEEGKSLSWLMAEERRLVLEIDLLEIHGLTVPPRTHPLRDSLLRRYALEDLNQALSDVRIRRFHRQILRWVRRILTLGRWWK